MADAPNPLREPEIHSHITDCLPEDHPLAREQVRCKVCSTLVHAFNNECMTTWIETGRGVFCVPCFVAEIAETTVASFPGAEPWMTYCLDDDLGLPA